MRAKRSRSGVALRQVPVQTEHQPERAAEGDQLNRITRELPKRRKASYWKPQGELPMKEIPSSRRRIVPFGMMRIIPSPKTRARAQKKSRSSAIGQTRFRR